MPLAIQKQVMPHPDPHGVEASPLLQPARPRTPPDPDKDDPLPCSSSQDGNERLPALSSLKLPPVASLDKDQNRRAKPRQYQQRINSQPWLKESRGEDILSSNPSHASRSDADGDDHVVDSARNTAAVDGGNEGKSSDMKRAHQQSPCSSRHDLQGESSDGFQARQYQRNDHSPSRVPSPMHYSADDYYSHRHHSDRRESRHSLVSEQLRSEVVPPRPLPVLPHSTYETDRHHTSFPSGGIFSNESHRDPTQFRSSLRSYHSSLVPSDKEHISKSVPHQQPIRLSEKRKADIAPPPGSSIAAYSSMLTPFIYKLFCLVSDDATNDLCHWSVSGDSFVVPDPTAFAARVLPQYFKHNQFASFVRQLNKYRFHKLTPGTCIFGHEKFLRNRPDLLPEIVRQRSPDRPSVLCGPDTGIHPSNLSYSTAAARIPQNVASSSKYDSSAPHASSQSEYWRYRRVNHDDDSKRELLYGREYRHSVPETRQRLSPQKASPSRHSPLQSDVRLDDYGFGIDCRIDGNKFGRDFSSGPLVYRSSGLGGGGGGGGGEIGAYGPVTTKRQRVAVDMSRSDFRRRHSLLANDSEDDKMDCPRSPRQGARHGDRDGRLMEFDSKEVDELFSRLHALERGQRETFGRLSSLEEHLRRVVVAIENLEKKLSNERR